MEPLATLLTRLARERPELTPQVRKAAGYVLENPGTVGTLSMRKLALQADVPPPTLPRLAKALGYETYEAFRDIFRAHLQGQTQGYAEQAGNLQRLTGADDPHALLDAFRRASMDNIDQTIAGLDPTEVAAVVEALRTARTVYVVGMQASFAAAAYFHYVGSMACGNWVLLDSRSGNVSELVVDMAAGDVLVAVAMPPSARETIIAADFARRRGVTVVGITSSRVSPLAERADHVLLVSMRSPQFFESYVTTILVLETLVGFVVATGGQDVVETIDRIEACRRDLGEYWQDP